LLSGVTHSFQRIEEIASKRPRRWPMLLTGAFSLLLSFLLYLGFETQEERFIQRLIDEEGRGLAALIERDFFLRETALTRMADRLAASPVHLLTGWAGDAQNYLHDFPGYERIGWCRSPEEIHWVTPEGGGHRLFEKIRPTEHTPLLEALQRIEERRKPSALLLPKLAEGEFALLHLVPIVSGDRYLGTLLTLSSLSPWIDTVFSEISPAYGISLHAGGMEIYRRIPAAPKERFLWEGPLSLGMDPAWRLRVVPNRTFVSQNRSGLPIFALFFGIVISGMMMLVFHLKESGRLRTTQFETTNRFLFEEIEKRRTAQSRYEDSTAFLEAIVENVPLMIFVKEAENLHFVLFNRAGVELTGISQEEILGKTDHDFFPPEEAEFFIAKDREVLAGKDVLVIEEEPLHTRHRGVRLLRTRKVPIRDASGKPKFLLGVSEDITERKTRDREREKQRRALERSNAELEQFAYVASHDLQEPLRTVASYADLLEERAGECLDEKT
ncbi:MAG: PAS domain S-box protein, partial [Deltaproteobacteria bacterium]